MAIFNSGVRGKRAKDGVGIVGSQTQFIQQESPLPTITSFSIDGSDDLALDPAGGQTVVVHGTGFAPGMTGIVGSTEISAVTVVSPTKVTFTSTAKSAGSYTLTLANSNGSAAILVPGIVYSSVPTFSTGAGSIGTYYETKPINTSVTATSDTTVTYSLVSGALPSGATLNNDGTITGTSPVENASTTYNFSIKATDAELQDVTRSFTLTINTDVVSWVTPSNSATINLDGAAYSQALTATDAAGYSVSYTANALPTGLTLSSGTISGTPTVEETVSTLLTATAATTNRTATNTITWVVSLSDVYFKYSTLLLSANSSIQTSSFVSDNSINNQQLTVAGDTRATNFNPYQVGYYSNFFDGTGDYLTTGASSNFDMGTGDFTIECFALTNGYAGSQYGRGLFALYPSGSYNKRIIVRHTNADNRLNIYGYDGSSTYFGSSGTSGTQALTTGTWNHIALVRQSGVFRLYINGVQDIVVSNQTAITLATSNCFDIGRVQEGTVPEWNGNISNFRVIKGTCLYNNGTTFTPPTTPFLPSPTVQLLTCQSNGLIDSSPTNISLTKGGDTTVSSAHPFSKVYQAGTQYYSTKFNGSSDYLTIASNSAFQFGTGDFTIECWIYPTTLASNNTNNFINIGTYLTGILMRTNSSGGVQLYFVGNSKIPVQAGLTVNAWNHVALVRIGTNCTLYINGASNYSFTDSSNLSPATATVTIGMAAHNSSEFFTGNISNMRIVKGVGVYTGTFTVPTSPLTAEQPSGTNINAITSGQTSLLTLQSNTFVDNSSNAFALTVGTTTIKPVAVSPFTPSSYTNTEITTYGSGYFSATSAYTTYSPAGTDIFGTGDFTVECWFNPTSTTAVNISMASTATSTWELLTYANQLYWHENGGNLGGTGYGSIPLSSWSHLAVSRSGTTLRMFINGVQVYSATNSYNYSASPTTRSIGPYNGGSAPAYISDFRVIKGTALYTSNFVPQFTSPLTNITNTQLLTLQTNGSHNNSTFNDSSGFNNVITRNGNTTNGTFSPYGDNWSVLFNSSTITLPSTHTAFAAANEDFTIECWIYLTSSPGAHSMICGWNTSPYYDYWEVSTTGMGLNMSNNYNAGCIFSFAVNTWYHVAFTRQSNSVKAYVNGNLQSTNTVSNSFGVGNAAMRLGNWYTTPNYYFPGYISNFRFVKGTAITPPTDGPSAPVSAVNNTTLLINQSPMFADNSINNYALTLAGNPSVQKFSPFSTVTVPKYYSTKFDGTGDNLSTVCDLGTSQFTAECWGYMPNTATGAQQVLFSQYITAPNGRWAITVSTTGYPEFVVNGLTEGNLNIVAGSTIQSGVWHHFAVTRNASNVFTFWVNGVSVGTGTRTGSLPSSSVGFTIGGLGNAGGTLNLLTGYVSNLRIVKNTVLYTSNFTPSTTPLTAVSGTVLLTCQDNTFKDNSTNNFTVTASGDAKPLPVSPFTPTSSSPTSYSPAVFGGSMYFDGSGDYLSFASSYLPTVAGVAFTLEFWIYPTRALSTDNSIISSGNIELNLVNPSGQIRFDLPTGVTNVVNSGSNYPVANAWNHIALVRTSNNAYTLFLNGINVGTGSSSTAITTLTTFGYRASNSLQGYVSDLRVTSGSALYTSNFYPGPTPLTPTPRISANTYSSTLLLSGTSGGVIDATRTVDLETVADAKVTNFSPYNRSYYSVNFSGVSGYIGFTQPVLGNTFTIEMWILPIASPTTDRYYYSGGSTTGPVLGYNGTIFSAAHQGSWTIASSTNPTMGSWNHVALVREGLGANQFKLYLNGTLVGTGTDATTFGSQTGAYIGSNNGSNGSSSYISNVRITNNQALYTGSFTPSTSPLTSTTVGSTGSGAAASLTGTVALLACQSNKFVDNSASPQTLTPSSAASVQTSNPFQVNTGQSYYFDGTGDYLISPNSVEMSSLASSNFTVEFWVYSGQSVAGVPLVTCASSGGGASATNWGFFVNAGVPRFVVSDGSAYQVLINGNITLNNSWTHLAATRSGNVYTFYINGSAETPVTWTGTPMTTSRPVVVAANTGTVYLNGFIADLRITKGVARYTSSFTPPTSPLKLN